MHAFSIFMLPCVLAFPSNDWWLKSFQYECVFIFCSLPLDHRNTSDVMRINRSSHQPSKSRNMTAQSSNQRSFSAMDRYTNRLDKHRDTLLKLIHLNPITIDNILFPSIRVTLTNSLLVMRYSVWLFNATGAMLCCAEPISVTHTLQHNDVVWQSVLGWGWDRQ